MLHLGLRSVPGGRDDRRSAAGRAHQPRGVLLVRFVSVRRLGSVLFLLALGACAHEANRSARSASRATASSPERAPGTAVLATSEPSPLSADDAALGTQFEATRALSSLDGEASYYSDRLAGHKTASGERYRPNALTAAHRSLPLGTVLRVTRSDGARTVYVRINDRGPYGSSRRILDLSRAAFERLGSLRAGVLEVRAEVVAYGQKRGH
jgi:rare lipoprotein A